MTVSRIKLSDSNWKYGRVMTYNERHRVTVDAVGTGPVTLIFDFNTKKKTTVLAGIERIVGGDPQADVSGRPEYLPSSAVAKSAWLRVWREYWARRSSIGDRGGL